MKFIPQYEPLIKPEYAKNVRDQILSGWIGPGEKVEELESLICEKTGSKHCISTTSGTMALYLALKSYDLKYYDNVIFPDYTFLAGANAARMCDYKVQLIDIKEDTLCINPDELDKILSYDRRVVQFGEPKIGAVFFVNHNGYCGEDRLRVKQICDRHGAIMLEDSCQSIGISDIDSTPAGMVGNCGFYSFSVPKLITGGQGGCVFTNSFTLAEKCRQIRDHGGNWRKTRQHHRIGANLKYNDIQAELVLSQLKIIDELLGLRKQLFNWYREEQVKLIDFGMDSTWMAITRTKNAKQLISALLDNNIQATQYYNPVHTNSPYAHQRNDDFPVANKVAQEIVYLPSSLNLEKRDIQRICKVIKNVEKESSE